MRIDLQTLVDSAPECWKWFPDLFPGAKGKIWLTENNQCVCRIKIEPGTEQHQEDDDTITQITGKRGKCKCSVKVLVFDTGHVVITGARTISDVNSVFARIRMLAPDFQSDQQNAIPREDRFYHRLSTMMVPIANDSNTTTKPVNNVKRDELNPEEAVACVLAGMDLLSIQTLASRNRNEDDITPLMRMAEEGRLEDIEMMIMMDPSCIDARDNNGLNTLDRLNTIPVKDRQPKVGQIIKLLSSAK